MGGLNETLSKIPIAPLLILGAVLIGYNFYQWKTSPTSPLNVKEKERVVALQAKDKAKKELQEAETFYKNLDTMKNDILQLSSQLEQAKGMLTSEFDVAQFIKLLTLEAKKLGIVIKKITPGADIKKELFSEVPFKLEVVGAYIQLLVFFDRIARFQQVMKVDTFTFKPTGTVSTKYIELDGTVNILAYKYLSSSSDEAGKVGQ